MLQDNEKMKVQYRTGISVDFKFHGYGNQNQNHCQLLIKQNVYCLSKRDVQNVI